MDKKLIVIVAAVLIVISLISLPRIILSGMAVKYFEEDKSFIVTKENFAEYLKQHRVIKDFPKNALVSLKLYNFDSGSKQVEKSYIISKANVVEGETKNPDLIISANSKYVSMINDAGFCLTVQNARLNRDIEFEYRTSKIAFLWKYKSLIKYGGCFGF